MDFSPIDITIIAVIVISSLVGWFRGATKELFTLISWCGSAFLTIKLFPIGQKIVQNFVTQPLLSDVITGIAIFILFLIVLSTLSYLFSSLVKNSLLNIPDKICGVLYGAVRGIFILACIDFGITGFVLTNDNALIRESQLHPHLQQVAHMTFVILPDNIQQSILKHISSDKKKELMAHLKTEVKESASVDSNFAQQQLEDHLKSGSKSRSGTQSAEELSKLNVKKSQNGEQDAIARTHKELDGLLSQIS